MCAQFDQFLYFSMTGLCITYYWHHTASSQHFDTQNLSSSLFCEPEETRWQLHLCSGESWILRVPNLYLEVSRTLQEPRKSFDFRLHKRTSTVTNGLTALRHTFLLFQLDKRGTTFPNKSMFLYFMFACSLESTQHTTPFVLRQVKTTRQWSIGKRAKTKQPTTTTACQWSLQRLSMQSHKEGSKSERVPVCLYSLTASQNPRQLRLFKIVDTIPSVRRRIVWS